MGPATLTPVLISFLYYVAYGLKQVVFLALVFHILFIYILWKICIRNATVPARRLVGAFVRLGAIVLGLLFVIAVSLEYIAVTSMPAVREDIAMNNHALMQADAAIFGTYVPFWFQSSANSWKPLFDAVAPLLEWAYRSLGVFLGLLLLFLLFTNDRLFAQMFLSCLFSILVAFPLWYVFPAMSPVIAYWHPIVEPHPSTAVQSVLELYEPNGNLLRYMEERVALDEGFPDGFLNITAIPSMHISWGTLLLYFSLAAWRPLALVIVPYVLLNMLSTVYLMQHYAVDIPAGILVALLSILLVVLLRLDRSRDVALLSELLREDLWRFLGMLPVVGRLGR